jgi:hypothetical protein
MQNKEIKRILSISKDLKLRKYFKPQKVGEGAQPLTA